MDFLNTPEKKERRLVHLPMGRFGEAVELAKAALFRTFLLGRHDLADLISSSRTQWRATTAVI